MKRFSLAWLALAVSLVLAPLASAQTIASRLATLSSRERQIMDLILAGKLNKIIADELRISIRTVEVHRARLLEKMGVKTAVELAQLLKRLD